MPDYNFKIITEKLLDIKYDNVDLISGNWNKQILSDSEIKKFYIESFLTLIPLKNSFQPSGQSVALQSMSVGTPVLITNTNGFGITNCLSQMNIYSFARKMTLKFGNQK